MRKDPILQPPPGRGIRSPRPFVLAGMKPSVKKAAFALTVAAAFALTAIAAPGFLSIGGDEAEAATTHTVFVNDSFFCGSAGSSCTQPFKITINQGDAVQWLDGQAGIVAHTVTQCTGNGTGCPGGSPGFDSGSLTDPPSGYFTQPQHFPIAGTFFYRCQIHLNSMRGIVEVVSTSVGGIADFPDIDESPTDASGSSSGGSSLALAVVSGFVAAVAMLAAGAWYVRRRWLQGTR